MSWRASGSNLGRASDGANHH